MYIFMHTLWMHVQIATFEAAYMFNLVHLNATTGNFIYFDKIFCKIFWLILFIHSLILRRIDEEKIDNNIEISLRDTTQCYYFD